MVTSRILQVLCSFVYFASLACLVGGFLLLVKLHMGVLNCVLFCLINYLV